VEIQSFVQTDSGFVFTTTSAEGTEVKLADGSMVVDIGRGVEFAEDWSNLAADDTGNLVGWVEPGRPPEFVVYDTAQRREVLRTHEGNSRCTPVDDDELHDGNFAHLDDIDDGEIYWTADAGRVRYDLATGDTTVLFHGSVGPEDMGYVANGRHVRVPYYDGRQKLDPRWGRGTAVPGGRPYLLSPTAARIVTGDKELGGSPIEVFELATRKRTRVPLEDYGWARAYQWLDDDTFVAVAVPKSSTPEDVERQAGITVLTCHADSGTCEMDGVTGPEVYVKGLVLPDGHRAIDCCSPL
jgi:hypothetical protein